MLGLGAIELKLNFVYNASGYIRVGAKHPERKSKHPGRKSKDASPLPSQCFSVEV